MIISNSSASRSVASDRRDDVPLSDEEDEDKEEEEDDDDDEDFERADGGTNDEERKLLDELEGLEEAEEEEYSGPLLAEEEEDEEVEREDDGEEEEEDAREVEDVEEEEEEEDGHDVAPEAEAEAEPEPEPEPEPEHEHEPEPEAELEADVEVEAEDGENKAPSGEPAVLDFLRRPPELDEGTPQEQAEFSRELAQFFSSRKMDYRPPKFYGKNLNLLKLWRTVIRLGAYDYVTANKLWRQVGETFNPPKKCTTVSWSFRVYYEKSLLDYERQKLQGTDYSSGRSSHLDSRRAKRDAARRAMQGWHSKKILDDDDEAICSPKDKTAITPIIKQEKQFKTGVLKRKNPTPIPEQNNKAARTMNGTKANFVGNSTSKNENGDHNYQSYNVIKRRQQVFKPGHAKPISKGSSYHLMNGIDIRVADEGPEADWVKINVHKTGDCFEVYALVPGLLQEELRVQCEPGGMLVIIGEPEQPNNPWGVTPFKKIIKLPLPIDANQTSAVITLHGQLFVRVPYGERHS